jgi:hypothetical protein
MNIYKQVNKIGVCSIIALIFGLFGCEESKRFEIGYDDKIPPGPPVFIDYKPLYGGVRIYFTPPADEDVLTIDASYKNQQGKDIWFSVSYYTDSLSVYGFPDENPRELELYAVDRAGNRSVSKIITVTPKEPAVTRVANSFITKGGFGSFYVFWRNELKQNMNVYVDFKYNFNGEIKDKHIIYTSTDTLERRFIRMDDLPETEPVSVKMTVEDRYGNKSEVMDMGNIYLMKDEVIPKDKWTIPQANDSIGYGESRVPMAFLFGYEGDPLSLFNNIISNGLNRDYAQTEGRGRTGIRKDGDMPWNLLIDLGEEWELSRIVTYQRYRDQGTGTDEPMGRQEYYNGSNVQQYKMYTFDSATEQWDSIRTHFIPVPIDLTGMQYKVLGRAGDLAYMYVEEPHFTKPTRWFRYECLKLFGSGSNGLLSEITLYGRRKQQ